LQRLAAVHSGARLWDWPNQNPATNRNTSHNTNINAFPDLGLLLVVERLLLQLCGLYP